MIRPEIEQIIKSLKHNSENWKVERQFNSNCIDMYYYYVIYHPECKIEIRTDTSYGWFGPKIDHIKCGYKHIDLNRKEKRALKKKLRIIVRKHEKGEREEETRKQAEALAEKTECLLKKENYK